MLLNLVDEKQQQGDDETVEHKWTSLQVSSRFANHSGWDNAGISIEKPDQAVYSASVTLTARMAPGSGAAYGDNSLPAATGFRWGAASSTAWWRVTSERLPLIVGIFCGGFLLTLLLLAVIIYRCCIMPRSQKHYCIRKTEEQPSTQLNRAAGLSQPIYPSHSAVYVDSKSGSWSYNSRILQQQPLPGPSNCSGTGHTLWQPNSRLNTSTSTGSTSSGNWFVASRPQVQGILKRGSVSSSDGRLAIAVGVQHTPDIVYSSTNRLTVSQVPRSSSHPGVPCPTGSYQPQSLPNYSSSSYNAEPTCCNEGGRRPRPHSQPVGPCDIMHADQDIINKQLSLMPQICEFSAQQIGQNQYASSSVLDEVNIRAEETSSSGTTLKTRSLPAWVRSKARPLSTEDDLAELYAKVNFSKKRKNRMRNDEAAIIALSKSRSQFLHTNKDTDSLVNNEAVIVYDERTAL